VYGTRNRHKDFSGGLPKAKCSFSVFPVPLSYRLPAKAKIKYSDLFPAPSPASSSDWLFRTFGRQVADGLRLLACDVVQIQHCSQYLPVLRALNPNAEIVLHLLSSGSLNCQAGVCGLAAITLPLTVIASGGSKPFLRLWIGAGFAEAAAPVCKILLIGGWINRAVMHQGQGRLAIIAKLRALELVRYVAILWIGVAWAGLPGAAWAWVLRVVIDVLLLFW
jgi:hypothetical protein